MGPFTVNCMVPLTFHGVFEVQIIDVVHGLAVSRLAPQAVDPLDQVCHHCVHIVGEHRHVFGLHDLLPQDAAHLQPVLALAVHSEQGMSVTRLLQTEGTCFPAKLQV